MVPHPPRPATKLSGPGGRDAHCTGPRKGLIRGQTRTHRTGRGRTSPESVSHSRQAANVGGDGTGGRQSRPPLPRHTTSPGANTPTRRRPHCHHRRRHPRRASSESWPHSSPESGKVRGDETLHRIQMPHATAPGSCSDRRELARPILLCRTLRGIGEVKCTGAVGNNAGGDLSLVTAPDGDVLSGRRL